MSIWILGKILAQRNTNKQQTKKKVSNHEIPFCLEMQALRRERLGHSLVPVGGFPCQISKDPENFGLIGSGKSKSLLIGEDEQGGREHIRNF